MRPVRADSILSTFSLAPLLPDWYWTTRTSNALIASNLKASSSKQAQDFPLSTSEKANPQEARPYKGEVKRRSREESADKPGTAVPLSSSSLPLTKNYVYKEEFCLSALPFKQTFITARAKIASVILSDNIGVVLAKAKGSKGNEKLSGNCLKEKKNPLFLSCLSTQLCMVSIFFHSHQLLQSARHTIFALSPSRNLTANLTTENGCSKKTNALTRNGFCASELTPCLLLTRPLIVKSRSKVAFSELFQDISSKNTEVNKFPSVGDRTKVLSHPRRSRLSSVNSESDKRFSVLMSSMASLGRSQSSIGYEKPGPCLRNPSVPQRLGLMPIGKRKLGIGAMCNYEVSRAGRIEQLNEQIETLEMDVGRARTIDAHRADQLGHLHEVEGEQ
ncbi:hypothetical protein SASPL_155491 (mitochondrion) [Salvia splendens]|uniref:Uncharacterized protein n=1 Tax=Salvia splendens TaxID=180675 RepID=A0A8X8VX21_SALSN|nr:hypothetical protein SASPL_156298 [Salvia splendens]KAG6384648.1 hypothetical protein SASPL_155491 [Salvia splendens]